MQSARPAAAAGACAIGLLFCGNGTGLHVIRCCLRLSLCIAHGLQMKILSSFCKGSSIVADFGCVIHAVLLKQASRKLATWWEHVDSKANIADGGTRADFSTVHRFGISLQQRPHPPWPDDVFSAPPAFWLGCYFDEA